MYKQAKPWKHGLVAVEAVMISSFLLKIFTMFVYKDTFFYKFKGKLIPCHAKGNCKSDFIGNP